jgi:OFA family oxalate/formate antiporter-like MFS transporter
MTAEIKQKRGWQVTFAGLGINLSLGVLYSWAMFADALQTEQFGWSATQTQIPYMVACAVFAFLMVPGGRLQDKLGPKPVLTAAAALTAVGFFMSGTILSVFGLSIFFGIMFGSAMGFGYAATTPPAIKWFGAHQRGLVSGIVVSGFGLAGIYAAPLAGYLINQFGLKATFYILGAVFSAAIFLCARFIDNPPAGYVTAEPVSLTKSKKKSSAENDYDWKEMIRTPQFFSLWIMFCFGTFAGLLIIGQLKRIGMEQASLTPSAAMLLVVLYAIFNFAGRISCGIISDKMDRRMTLVAIFLLQVVSFVFFARFTTTLTIFIGTAAVAFAFGGMLSLFPTIACDYFGLKNMGLNYGLIFTAWGAGGVFGPLLGGLVRDTTGAYNMSYAVAAALSGVGMLLALATKAPSTKKVSVPIICPSCGENVHLQSGSVAG